MSLPGGAEGPYRIAQTEGIPMSPTPDSSIYAVVRRYADAWAANDLRAIVDCYHDDVVFHYFGRNPLAGTHRGKAACLAVLK